MIGELRIEANDGAARCGQFSTTHGSFETPNFMPVGSAGTVKGMTPRSLREIGTQIVLANTYHLHLRPGDELIKELGGLHEFMQWDGPILTDSGGFQVYSLAKLRKLTEDGVTFQSHIDGKKIEFTPERVVEIQQNLGVDIMMQLDECPPHPAKPEDVAAAIERTTRWGERCLAARTRAESLLFGIVQGGEYPELRAEAVERTTATGFDGYAIGGVSVGEPTDVMRRVTEQCAPLLPQDKIRYLMGVGMPCDILHAVMQGVDLFDCVIPTRSARFGRIFSGHSHFNVRNQAFRADPRPLDEDCDCYTCANFSRAYIAHLVHAGEVLAIELATTHNLRFYQRLMERIRNAIREERLGEFAAPFFAAEREP